MAFPTIPTAGASTLLTTNQNATTTTHTFPNLSSLPNTAGALLLAIIVTYRGGAANAEFSSWGGGFTEFIDQSANSTTIQSIGAAYKLNATGSESGTFTVTTVSSTRSVMFLMEIPGAHTSTLPEATAKANGTTAAADPAALDPANWAAEDTLWIAVAVNGETSLTGSFTGITAAPTNYTNYLDSGIIGGDVIGALEGAVAFRQLNTSSEDVGTFTLDVGAAGNSALLIAVRPAAAAEQNVTAHGISSEEYIGLANTASVSTVAVNGIRSEERLGQPTVTTTVTIAALGISSNERVGHSPLTTTVNVSVNGITSSETFGAPNVQVITAINAHSIPSTERLGSPTLTTTRDVAVLGITSSELLGNANVATASIINANSIYSSEHLGAPSVGSTYTINANGIVSDEQFGSAAIPSMIFASGITTEERLGNIATQVIVAINAHGIISEERIGQPSVTSIRTVSVNGIYSTELFGLTNVSPASVINAGGIASVEHLGAALVTPGAATISAHGIVSGELLGRHIVSLGLLQLEINAGSIYTAERVGNPYTGRQVDDIFIVRIHGGDTSIIAPDTMIANIEFIDTIIESGSDTITVVIGPS